jgi:hypothetical protein
LIILAMQIILKRNKIHIIPVIFGSLLALPLIIIVVLQLWQVYLSNTAYERMEEENVQTLVVESSRVVWKEAGREVTIDGEYFDLVSWSLKDGKYTFTGVFDKEETAIAAMLEKQSSTSNFISRLLLFSQCFAAMLSLISFMFFSRFQKSLSFFSSQYKFLFQKIIAPPPKAFFHLVGRNLIC